MTTKRFVLGVYTALLVLGIGTSNILAQSGAKDTEFSADRTLRSSARINPSTLAMEFSLPLGSYPGRAGNSVPVSISYSSKVWEMKHFGTTLIYSSIKYQHNAIFSDKSASGWTSSMQPPRLRSTVGLYNWWGEQYTPHYQSMMLMPEIPFEYNASGMSLQAGCYTKYSYYYVWGFRINIPYRVCYPDYFALHNYSMGPYPQDIQHSQRFMVKRFYVTMPDGSSVEFRKDDNYYPLCDSQTNPPPGCLNNFSQAAEGAYLSVDGSGMRLQIDELQADSVKRSVLYLPNGGKYIFSPAAVPGVPAEKFIDVNGNETLFQVDELGNRQTVDTLNRTIKDPFPDRWYGGPQEAGTQEFKLKGLGGTDVTYSQTWTPLKTEECAAVTTANCGETALEEDTQVLSYRGDAECIVGIYSTLSPALFVGDDEGRQVCGRTRGGNATRFNPAVLTEISLPNGARYKFKYNIYGEITRIDYPTGAYERFRYDDIPPLGYGTEEVYSQTNRGVVERWVSSDGLAVDQHWTYGVTEGVYPSTDYVVKAFAPDGSHTERYLGRSSDPYYGFTDPLAGMPYDERAYDSNGVLRSRNLTEWITKAGTTSNIGALTRDPRVKRTVSILFDPNSASALTTMSETDYDETGSADPTYFSHLNVKRKKGYHYAAVSKTSVDNESLSWTTIAGWFTGKLASISEVDYSYDPDYRSRGIIGLPTQTRALSPVNPGDVLSKSEPVYDEGAYFINAGTTVSYQSPTGANAHLRGNVTTSRTWVKETDTWLQTHTAYDNFGNIRKVWDASGDPDRFVETEYSSEYNYAYPTKVIAPAPDPSGTHGTSSASSAETTYDPTTGLVLSVTDDFGQVTKTEYNDPLLRLTRVSGYNFTAPIAETIYDDTNRTVRVRKQLDESNWDEATTYMDGLGRAIKTVARDSEGDVTVETHYDLMGRVDRVTDPYRTGDTVYWNRTRYDELGRAVESYAPAALADLANAQSLGVTSFGISTATNYTGTVVTTTDASGRKGRSITNALGQLLRVDEPTAVGGPNDLGDVGSPNQPTYYKYDLLRQHGAGYARGPEPVFQIQFPRPPHPRQSARTGISSGFGSARRSTISRAIGLPLSITTTSATW